MKKVILVLSFALSIFIILGQLASPALAETKCQHSYELVDINVSHYGNIYHSVSQCPNAPYTHDHFYLGGTHIYTYVCIYCDNVKTETRNFIDYESGDHCTLDDNGKGLHFIN